MNEIDETYTFFSGIAENEKGELFDIMNVNDRAVIADMIVVIQELQAKVEALESKG